MKKDVRARLLQAWMAWALPRPYLVLGVSLALSVASVLLAAFSLDFKTSQLDLISPDNPLIHLSKELRPFENRDSFTVVIEAPTPHRAVSFLTELTRRLQRDATHFKEVFFRVDPQRIRPWALLYMDTKDLQRLRHRMEEYPTLLSELARQPDLGAFLGLVNQEMASRMVGELFTGFLKEDGSDGEDGDKDDPMDLGFFIRTLQGLKDHLDGSMDYRSPWSDFFKDSVWDRDLEGYFWVADKRFLILFVTPRRDKTTFNRAQASLKRLRSVIAEAAEAVPGVRVGVTGQDALKTDEMTVALGDMSWATWISFAGVWILNSLFFRSEGRTVIRMVVLTVGMCWTFGWLTLFVGHLNILSMVFAPMLVGLGDDYAVHWFARMEEEERDKRLSREEVIMRVAERSGPGILVAGFSGALSFLPLILTGFKGLVELGLIAGVGLLFQVVADFTLLPVLSRFSRGRRGGPRPATRPDGEDLLRYGPRSAAVCLAGAFLLTIVAAYLAGGVQFDLNPLRLQSKGAESVIWEEVLRQNSKRSVLSACSISTSPEEVLDRSRAFGDLPTVKTVQSIFTLLPEGQDEKIPLLRTMLAEFRDAPLPGALAQSVAPGEMMDLLGRIRFKMDDEQADKWGAKRPVVEQIAAVRALTGDILERLKAPGGTDRGLQAYAGQFRDDLLDTLDLLHQGSLAMPMEVGHLPAPLRQRFLRDDRYLIRIYPAEDIWDWGPRERFVTDLRRVDPRVVGDAVTLHAFTQDYRTASINAALYAVAGIFIMLLVEFRNWRLSLLALIPLLLGSLWTIGAMRLLGIQLNLANSMFLPLIVGAGVEYGIIILHRWREGGMRPGCLPLSTGKGVVLAALTTTFGFGSLMICRHQGIFSLGLLSFAGSLLVLAAAVLLLPAILTWGKQLRVCSRREV